MTSGSSAIKWQPDSSKVAAEIGFPLPHVQRSVFRYPVWRAMRPPRTTPHYSATDSGRARRKHSISIRGTPQQPINDAWTSLESNQRALELIVAYSRNRVTDPARGRRLSMVLGWLKARLGWLGKAKTSTTDCTYSRSGFRRCASGSPPGPRRRFLAGHRPFVVRPPAGLTEEAKAALLVTTGRGTSASSASARAGGDPLRRWPHHHRTCRSALRDRRRCHRRSISEPSSGR
jgi:hypothetical protein